MRSTSCRRRRANSSSASNGRHARPSRSPAPAPARRSPRRSRSSKRRRSGRGRASRTGSSASASSSRSSASEWALHFSAVLEAAGFPGERALDSDELQTRAKWHELLGELSKLERISESMSFSAAFATLRRLCAETLFQPESPDAPIQILGVIETQGQRFDCLWVTGLTDQVWPRDAHPNPFIPVALQKKAGI